MYLKSLMRSSISKLSSFFSQLPIKASALVLVLFVVTVSITLSFGTTYQASAQQAPEQNQVGLIPGLPAILGNFLKFNIPIVFEDRVSFNGDVEINGQPLTPGSGVNSVQGQTGAVLFTAGDGMEVIGTQLVNTDPGSGQNFFQSIIAGSNTLLATSNADQLIFEAGNGIAISGSDKQLTISSTASFDPTSSGWTRSGNNLTLSNNGDLVGIGTANPSAKLHVAGTATFDDTLSALGSVQVTGDTELESDLAVGQNIAVEGNATISGTLTSNGATVISPTGNQDSLTVRSGGGTGNILNITNQAGDASYLSIGSDGSLTAGGSTLTNSGLFASSGAIHLTDATTALVGTAIEGGWTLGDNTFNYRRIISVTNTDESLALPTHYVVTVTITGTDAAHIFDNTREDTNDFRIAHLTTEIPRNISTFTASNVTFSFQLQSSIAADTVSDDYRIFYDSADLEQAAPNYLEDEVIDTLDNSPANWASTDATQFPVSSDIVVKQEGTAAMKVEATRDNIGSFSSEGVAGLDSGVSNFGFLVENILDTQRLYVVGGTTDGTSAGARSTIYHTSINSTSGDPEEGALEDNALPEAISDSAVAMYTPVIDAGTGEDGSIDLSLGGEEGGCSGVGLSWSSSTCTALVSGTYTSEKHFQNAPDAGTHSFEISSGTHDGKILTIVGNTSSDTALFDPATETYVAGPDLGDTALRGAHAFAITTGDHAGKTLVVLGGNSSGTRVYDPATHTFSAGPDLGASAGFGSNSFAITTGDHAGKTLTIRGSNSSLYDPAAHTFSAGPDLGASAQYGSHTFTIPSGDHAGKILVVLAGNTTTTNVYDPANHTFGAGPDLGATASNGSHTFTIPSGDHAGKMITIRGNTSNITMMYDPATHSYSEGPSTTSNPTASQSITITSGPQTGKILTLGQGSQSSLYDPASHTYSTGPSLGTSIGTGMHVIQISSGAQAGRYLMIGAGGNSTNRIYNPDSHTFINAPSIGTTVGTGVHSFTIPSGEHSGKIILLIGDANSETRLYDPATHTFSAGPDFGGNPGDGVHSFVIPSGDHAGKVLVLRGANSSTTRIYNPATHTFSAGPSLGTNAYRGAHSFTITTGDHAGKVLTVKGFNTTTTRMYDPATHTYSAGPNLSASAYAGAHALTITAGAQAGKALVILGNN
ncbi:MAG: hypothetical protein WDZ94_00470, partial [Patescibacteria group bacterium]